MEGSLLARLFTWLNGFLDVFILAVFLLGLAGLNIYSLVKSAGKEIEKKLKEAGKAREEQGDSAPAAPSGLRFTFADARLYLGGLGRAFYLWSVNLGIQIVIFGIWFGIIPLIKLVPVLKWIPVEVLRWLEIYILVVWLANKLTKRFGEGRGVYSALAHLSVLCFGWFVGRWFGMLLVSLPLIGLYYYLLYRIAEVLLTPADPEDKEDRRQRFKILTWYMWGLQYPIVVVADPTGVEHEMRIKSSPFNDFGMPGYVLTQLHQAVGLTKGMVFSRVAGPGAIYTEKFEQPQEIVDLRTQLRTVEVEAVTQDGVAIKAVVFAAFAIDRGEWSDDEYRRLRRANPQLRGGKLVDGGSSSYPYSPVRVRAALGLGGIQASVAGSAKAPTLRWDEQVVHMVAETARRALSERPLSELWLPSERAEETAYLRGETISALDLIARSITDGLARNLQEYGVRLYTARVVNYALRRDTGHGIDEITRQQLPIWRAHWEQRSEQKIATAEAQARQKLVDANALARSTLIASIAESLKESNIKNLPRYLVAVRFLGALDDLLNQQPSLATSEAGRLLRERLAFFKSNLPD